METVIKLAIERMSEEIERLKQTVGEQQKRISELEKNKNRSTIIEPTAPKPSDELLNNEQVKSILKIGKNSLIKLVRDGVLVAIRMNERTVRFSRAAIMEYIERKQGSRSLL
ncbi:helix-turn-helix domain-containing protein [Fluviicola sp.]|uniref:helix-turn-helix domain-containing protein n=1 Tax=Fluviicola sp. TaxID=1917219 RepID=UPI003D2CDBEC